MWQGHQLRSLRKRLLARDTAQHERSHEWSMNVTTLYHGIPKKSSYPIRCQMLSIGLELRQSVRYCTVAVSELMPTLGCALLDARNAVSRRVKRTVPAASALLWRGLS